MGWKWQGKTYESREALDEAKRRHCEAATAKYHADHLAKLHQAEQTRRHHEAVTAKYAAEHLAKSAGR